MRPMDEIESHSKALNCGNVEFWTIFRDIFMHLQLYRVVRRSDETAV